MKSKRSERSPAFHQLGLGKGLRLLAHGGEVPLAAGDEHGVVLDQVFISWGNAPGEEKAAR